MAGQWTSYELPKLPPGVSSAASTIKAILDTLTSLLNLLKGVLEVLSSLEIGNLSVAQLAIKAAIKTVETAIQAFMEEAGIYILFVPPRKRVVIPPVVSEVMGRIGVSSMSDLVQVKVGSALTVDFPKDNAAMTQFYDEVFSGNAGNAGFVRTVIESLDDYGDANRPQLGQNDAVFGMCVVAGSSDYFQLLSFLTAFQSLFGAGRPASSMEVPGLPVPQNLRVRPGGGGMFLEWDYQNGLSEIPSLNTSAMIKKIAIIRSKNPVLLSKTQPMEIFGGSDLTSGMKAGTGDDVIEIIDVISDASGANLKHDYMDTSTEFDSADSYFYTVAYGLSVGTTADLLLGKGQDIGFRRFSNVAKACVATDPASARSASGTAPDWMRTPRLPDMMPLFGKLIDRLSVYLQQFDNYTSGFGDMLKTYIKVLEQQILTYEEMAQEVTGTVNQLVSLLDVKANVGIYMRPIDGVGGTTFLKTDMLSAFSDTTDSQRPPFDRGDEYVGGLVLLAAAPSKVDLAPVKALIQQLVMSGGQEESVISAALKEIDKVLDSAEQSLAVTESAPISEPPVLGSDEPLQPDCPQTLARQYDFNDDLSVRGEL
jgi:hypothetical protein